MTLGKNEFVNIFFKIQETQYQNRNHKNTIKKIEKIIMESRRWLN